MSNDESVHPNLAFLREQSTLAIAAFRAVRARMHEQAEEHLLQLLAHVTAALAAFKGHETILTRPYLHRRSGRLYELVAIGLDTTKKRDGTPVAIYHRPNTGAWYVRERSEFNDQFEPRGGQGKVPKPT